MTAGARPYWETKTLAEMDEAEWEALCDGCGKCCLIGIEDADTGQIFLTDVSCKLLDTHSCRCRDYANRKHLVPDCVQLRRETIADLYWLPQTCAYRLVHEGRPLFPWHPLISGDPESVHAAGVSARGKARPQGRLKLRHLMKRAAAMEPRPRLRLRAAKAEGGGAD